MIYSIITTPCWKSRNIQFSTTSFSSWQIFPRKPKNYETMTQHYTTEYKTLDNRHRRWFFFCRQPVEAHRIPVSWPFSTSYGGASHSNAGQSTVPGIGEDEAPSRFYTGTPVAPSEQSLGGRTFSSEVGMHRDAQGTLSMPEIPSAGMISTSSRYPV